MMKSLNLEVLVEEPSAERALRLLLPKIVPDGLNQLEAASAIAKHMDVESNRSRSFQVFRDGLRRLVSEES